MASASPSSHSLHGLMMQGNREPWSKNRALIRCMVVGGGARPPAVVVGGGDAGGGGAERGECRGERESWCVEGAECKDGGGRGWPAPGQQPSPASPGPPSPRQPAITGGPAARPGEGEQGRQGRHHPDQAPHTGCEGVNAVCLEISRAPSLYKTSESTLRKPQYEVVRPPSVPVLGCVQVLSCGVLDDDLTLCMLCDGGVVR